MQFYSRLSMGAVFAIFAGFYYWIARGGIPVIPAGVGRHCAGPKALNRDLTPALRHFGACTLVCKHREILYGRISFESRKLTRTKCRRTKPNKAVCSLNACRVLHVASVYSRHEVSFYKVAPPGGG